MQQSPVAGNIISHTLNGVYEHGVCFFVIRPFFPNTLSEGEEFLVIYVIFHFLFLVWKLFKILQDLQMRMMCRSAYSYS